MDLLLSIFVSDIAPVLILAAIGYSLAKFVGVDARAISHVVFYAGLPCLVFKLLLDAPANDPSIGRVVALVTLQAVTLGLVSYTLARGSSLDPRHLRAFMLVVMFSNTGNFGLPIIQLAYGQAALTYAAVYFLTSALITTTLGPYLAGSTRRGLADSIREIFRLPPLYGMMSALAVRAAGVPVPAAVSQPINVLADMTLPLMLLILGMQLQRASRPPRPALTAVACVMSLVIAPLIAWTIASALGLGGAARQAAVTLSSMPSAVMTIIFALEFDLAPQFVTSTVFITTVLSPFTLTMVIALLR